MKTLIVGLAIGAVLIVVVIVALSHVAGLNILGDLLADPAHDGEQIEREAQEAGRKAAEEKKRELDAQTDAEVAADSAVADEHGADARHRHSDAIDAVRSAVDDLDRRLRADVRPGDREGDSGVPADGYGPSRVGNGAGGDIHAAEHDDSGAELADRLDQDLRERLRERAAGADGEAGE